MTAEQQALVAKNLGLPYWIVKRWFRWLPANLIETAEEAAVDALIRSAKSFDPTRGFTFSTYATTGCRLGVSRAIGNIIRNPVKQRALRCVALQTDDEFEQRWAADRRPGAPLQLERTELLDACRRVLPPHQWSILLLYHIEGYTLGEIGGMIGGVTRERVRQIIEGAIKKIRKHLPQYRTRDR